MLFCQCPLGCGRYLSSDDKHNRCVQCLGIQHAKAAFVDDSCACCGHMSMTSLRSYLSFVKRVAPSATTHPGLSGSSRGPAARALRDLRVTVRASLPAEYPQSSYSSHCGATSISTRKIRCWSQHRGVGYCPPRMKIRWGCPPRVLWLLPNRTWSW